jgi:hypothetical protein
MSIKPAKLTLFLAGADNILVFFPSGKFSGGVFWVARYPGRRGVFILAGEGFRIDRGKWSRRSQRSITVESQIVYEDKVARLPPGPTPGPVRLARFCLVGSFPGRLAAVLKSDGLEYVPLREPIDLAHLARLLRLKQPTGKAS